MPDLLSYAVLGLTVAVLALLLPFASHRTHLLWLARRRRPTIAAWEGPLPAVTIQLPVYNEVEVVERLIDAACGVDYPRDRLDVQVLDDSTDETVAAAAARVAVWRRRGVRVEHLRRGARTGFKAGALAFGAARARGDLLLVLDADFVAPPRLVHDLLPPFRDPSVGMVQARWDHLNAEENALTRAQALVLDGHFFFEQGGRYVGGRFFNFNGTAGMWRRRCLEDAGGWQADTLTEDLDLSYRAQMGGWKFVFLEDVGVPAEVPASVGALEVQQRRWAQGGIQTARKLLPALLRGPWPRRVKTEAAVHLLGHLAHPLTLALALLLFPSAVARRSLGLDGLQFLDLVALALATGPFVAFYVAAGRRRGTTWRRLLTRVPGVLSLGIGLSAPVSLAVLRGFRGVRDPFVRTPKRGSQPTGRYDCSSLRPDAWLKRAMATLMVAYIVAALAGGYLASVPFLILFASGYLRLGFGVDATGSMAVAYEPEQIHEKQSPHGQPDQGTNPPRLRPTSGLVVGG